MIGHFDLTTKLKGKAAKHRDNMSRTIAVMPTSTRNRDKSVMSQTSHVGLTAKSNKFSVEGSDQKSDQGDKESSTTRISRSLSIGGASGFLALTKSDLASGVDATNSVTPINKRLNRRLSRLPSVTANSMNARGGSNKLNLSNSSSSLFAIEETDDNENASNEQTAMKEQATLRNSLKGMHE